MKKDIKVETGKTIYWRWKGDKIIRRNRVSDVISIDNSNNNNILELDDFYFTEYPIRVSQKEIQIFKVL